MNRPAYSRVMRISTTLPPDLGLKFLELCDRMDCDRAWIVRELISMAVASDDFVRAALGDDYKGDFVVDINLPDVEAVRMYQVCKERADANLKPEQGPDL